MKKPILLLTLTILVILLSAVGSRPQQTHATGLNLNNVVSLWEFDIPRGRSVPARPVLMRSLRQKKMPMIHAQR